MFVDDDTNLPVTKMNWPWPRKNARNLAPIELRAAVMPGLDIEAGNGVAVPIRGQAR